jgi:hypothetical protein
MCRSGCAEVIVSEEYQQFCRDYNAFKDEVRQGKYGETAQIWINYCDSVRILLRFLEAVEENNLDLYIDSLYAMSSLLFSSDHLNYARYLPMYYLQLRQLVDTNPDVRKVLEKYGISVARSQVPACRNAIDLTIEQTINRSAKTSGGIIGHWTLNYWCSLIFI